MLADTTDVVLDPRLNGSTDVYALAFRGSGATFEAWLTLARTARDDGRRSMARAICTPDGFMAPEIISDEMVNAPSSMYDGVPTFDPCNPSVGIIVSDRPAPGVARRSNDLYMIRQGASGVWMAERMAINTDAWDDTPAFGSDGTTVYFASDRRRPGSGKADIYLTRRQGASWSEPILLQSICTDDRHEVSPYVVGKSLYYSTDQGGDQDVYVVQLDATGLPVGKPKPLAIPGVNQRGSNEYHPVITPGGRWIVFSSDRPVNGTRQYRLYYRAIPGTKDPVMGLRVTARTIIRDQEKLRFFGRLDSIFSVRTMIRVRDVEQDTSFTVATDADGYIRWKLSAASTSPRPTLDGRRHTYIVEAIPTVKGYVSSIDTLVIGSGGCSKDVEHTIYLNDTTSRRRTCEFTFRTFNVPFYVTTYWCPTTRKYRDLTPCTSLFTDDLPCEQLVQPTPCESNEAYQYSFEPAKINRVRRGSENCVNYNEFADSGLVWSDMVDRTIEHMRDEVRSALMDQCVKMAIDAGMRVEITYIVTTDDRSIHPHCMYTGRAYEDIQALAPHIMIDSLIVPYMRTGARFNAGGYGGMAGGNQLLSDLRSMYFAILFDNLCRETIPMYKQLQERGQLIVHSRGKAIDQRDLPYALKRAAGVEIRVPQYSQRLAGIKPPAGKSVVLCDDEGCR